MNVAFLIGRIIVGIYYFYSGIRHFIHLNMMAGYAGSKGVPLPKLAVAGSGTLLVIGGLSILIGYQPLVGVNAIWLFLSPTSFMLHNLLPADAPVQQLGEM